MNLQYLWKEKRRFLPQKKKKAAKIKVYIYFPQIDLNQH